MSSKSRRASSSQMISSIRNELADHRLDRLGASETSGIGGLVPLPHFFHVPRLNVAARLQRDRRNRLGDGNGPPFLATKTPTMA